MTKRAAVQQHRNWCQLVFGTFVAAAQHGIRIAHSGWERWLFDFLTVSLSRLKISPGRFSFQLNHNSWSQAKAASATENCFYFSNMRSLVYKYFWYGLFVYLLWKGLESKPFQSKSNFRIQNNSLPAQCLQILTDSQCRQCARRTQYACETSSMSCHDTVLSQSDWIMLFIVTEALLNMEYIFLRTWVNVLFRRQFYARLCVG